VKDPYSWTIDNPEAMVHNPKSEISTFSSDKEWFEIEANNLKDFATERGRSFWKEVRFEFHFAIYLPRSWMAPFTQAKFARIRITNLECEYMNVRSILKNTHNL
jgi:hypothetical protein